MLVLGCSMNPSCEVARTELEHGTSSAWLCITTATAQDESTNRGSEYDFTEPHQKNNPHCQHLESALYASKF